MDKTVEKIVYLGSIFLKIVAVPVLPSPPSPESNVVVYSKESLIPGRFWEATLNRGKGFSSRKGVVLEMVLLRRKVDMMGKTFSSSFVRDCSLFLWFSSVITTTCARHGERLGSLMPSLSNLFTSPELIFFTVSTKLTSNFVAIRVGFTNSSGGSTFSVLSPSTDRGGSEPP